MVKSEKNLHSKSRLACLESPDSEQTTSWVIVKLIENQSSRNF